MLLRLHLLVGLDFDLSIFAMTVSFAFLAHWCGKIVLWHAPKFNISIENEKMGNVFNKQHLRFEWQETSDTC